MSIGKGIVLLASLQQEGEGGELLGTGVEVHTREVVTEDVLDGFASAIAFGNVEVVEQVETLVEDVTGATGEVSDLEFLKVGIIYNV